jgi:VWFA-related protein
MGTLTWTRTVAPDVTTNAVPEGRLFVMLLDDLMLPADPAIAEAARRAAKSVIAHLSLTDQMAVVFTGGSGGCQNFTSDHVKLLAAVDQLKPGAVTYFMGWDTALPAVLASPTGPKSNQPSGPTFDGDGGLRAASMRTLEDVADALIGAPQHRKVLVLIGTGVPVNPGSAAPVLISGTGKGMPAREANQRLAEGMSELFRRMQRSNITVYPIDPSGVGGLENWIAGRLSTLPALNATPTMPPATINPATGDTDPPGGVPMIQDLAHFTARLDFDFLETVAANTGGRAIVNTNDFDPGIAQIFQENGSYYLIGYEATDPGSGKMHRLSVKVDRPDVEVRTRSGYYASDTKADAKAAKSSPVATAIASVLPNADLPMHVVLAPFASPAPAGPSAKPGPGPSTPLGTGATVVIVLGLSHAASANRASTTVDLQTSAFTPDGEARGTENQTARVTMMAGSPKETARYEVLSHIDLKPGRYQLRLAAHSSLENKVGSVFADVEVPDFANAPVSLSGVLFDASPSLTAAPHDALAAIVPIIPTAERTFDPRDRVSAFLRVYQGGKIAMVDVPLKIQLISEKGTAVVDRVDTMSAAGFDATTRAVDERIALPISDLPMGEYLLTLETTIGKTMARRDVRFRVK